MGAALSLIGNTPIVRLSKVIPPDVEAKIWAKCEFMNPSGSVKDRIALCMIREAEKRGELRKGMMLLVPTTGNTGIAFSLVGKLLGYEVVVIMPEGASEDRRRIARAYGAEVVVTPGGLPDTDRCLEYARELLESDPSRYFMFDQWSDEANVRAHYETTGKEIVRQLGRVDAVVAGIGTGGTLIGSALAIKEKWPDAYAVGVEPAECPVITEGRRGDHGIEGIGDGFVPDIVARYRRTIDSFVQVRTEDAVDMTRRLASEEGLLVGISSGANVLAAIEFARKVGLGEDANVVTFLPDHGTRYFAKGLL